MWFEKKNHNKLHNKLVINTAILTQENLSHLRSKNDWVFWKSAEKNFNRIVYLLVICQTHLFNYYSTFVLILFQIPNKKQGLLCCMHINSHKICHKY